MDEFSEWFEVKTLSDKYGDEYTIILNVDTTGPIFKILTANPMIQETIVGYANGIEEGNGVLLLADIRVREDVVVVHKRTGLFWKFKKVDREKKNFQQRGLGSELLNCFFTFAKEKGYQQIIGKVKRSDYLKNPALTTWYAAMGFTLTPEVETSTIVARISKSL